MYDRLMEPGGLETMTDFFIDLQLWGTPEQVYDKIVRLQEQTFMDGFMGVFSFAGMDHGEADRNMKLFARDVMPELQALAPVHNRLGLPV